MGEVRFAKDSITMAGYQYEIRPDKHGFVLKVWSAGLPHKFKQFAVDFSDDLISFYEFDENEETNRLATSDLP